MWQFFLLLCTSTVYSYSSAKIIFSVTSTRRGLGHLKHFCCFQLSCSLYANCTGHFNYNHLGVLCCITLSFNERSTSYCNSRIWDILVRKHVPGMLFLPTLGFICFTHHNLNTQETMRISIKHELSPNFSPNIS